MRRHILPKDDQGFTAIEIAMVASVIAIIALLILPLFRSRSEEAKIVAARDELQSLAKSLLVTEGDTGHFFRLQDMDNGLTPSDAVGNIRPDMDVPIVWSSVTTVGALQVPFAVLTDTQRQKLVSPASGGTGATVGGSYWRGPYLSFQKATTYGVLKATQPNLFVDAGGPLFDVTGGRGYPGPSGGLQDSSVDRIPVDPWGSPYVFINLAETGYGPRLLYSMGPDGLPGAGTPPIGPASYHSFRSGGQLGTGDDIEYIF